MSGKGDGRRPRQVSRDEYANNWEAVFGKKAFKLSDEQKEELRAFRRIWGKFFGGDRLTRCDKCKKRLVLETSLTDDGEYICSSCEAALSAEKKSMVK